MPIARWHPGKLFILWSMVGLLFLAVRYDESNGIFILLFSVAFLTTLIITWKWFSAREAHVSAHRNPRLPSAHPTQPPSTASTHPNQPQRLESVAASLAHLVAGNAPDDASTVNTFRQHTPLRDKELRAELISLRAAAAHFAIYSMFHNDQSRLSKLAELLYGQADPQILVTIRDRGRGYAAAISVPTSNQALFELPPEATTLHYTENPAQNAGQLFAFFCKCTREPLAILAGAALFTTTFDEARRLLQELGAA
jgi:hypothetical protein